MFLQFLNVILSRCIVACARGILRAHYVTMVIGTWAFSMEHKMQNRFVKSIDVETEAVAEDIVRKVCGKDHKEVGLVGNLAKEGLRDVGLSQRWFRWRAVPTTLRYKMLVVFGKNQQTEAFKVWASNAPSNPFDGTAKST